MNDKPAHEVKILAVEDDAGDYGLIRVYLRLAGYGIDVEQEQVRWATTVAEAKKILPHFKPDIVLLDLNLPDSDGLKTIAAMRQLLPDVPIIVLSGFDDKEIAQAALHEGAQEYVVKGHYDHDTLGKAVRHTLVRAKMENRLRMFEAALNAANNGIVITDLDAHIQWVNPAFTQLTGYSLSEALGRKPSELVKSGKQNQAFYKTLWDTILSGQTWRGEVVNRRKNGELYHEELLISPILNNKSTVTNFVAIKQDITPRKQLEEEVRQLAFYDALTKLPNRRLLNDRLTQCISANKRSECYSALMFLDLDNFKPLNDTHGHGVGDLLLIEASKRLSSCVRQMDTVARFGGDEFVVMVGELDADQTKSLTQANAVAEKVRSTLSAPYRLEVNQEGQPTLNIEHHCTVSIGVAVFLKHEGSQDDIIKWADEAMYQAKEAGRNTIRFYTR